MRNKSKLASAAVWILIAGFLLGIISLTANPVVLAKALQRYGIEYATARSLVRGVQIVEAVIVFLLFQPGPWVRKAGLILAAIFLVLGTVHIVLLLLAGSPRLCGCVLPLDKIGLPLAAQNAISLAKNIVLLGLCLPAWNGLVESRA